MWYMVCLKIKKINVKIASRYEAQVQDIWRKFFCDIKLQHDLKKAQVVKRLVVKRLSSTNIRPWSPMHISFYFKTSSNKKIDDNGKIKEIDWAASVFNNTYEDRFLHINNADSFVSLILDFSNDLYE